MGLFDTQISGNPLFAAPAQGPMGPVQFGSGYTNPTSKMPAMPSLIPDTTPSMNPMNLISMAGMVAGALAPKGSWQSNLGNVATQQAQTQLLADAQLKRDNDYRKFLTEALKFHTPAEIGALASQQVGNQGYFNPANGVGNPYIEPPKGSNGGN